MIFCRFGQKKRYLFPCFDGFDERDFEELQIGQQRFVHGVLVIPRLVVEIYPISRVGYGSVMAGVDFPLHEPEVFL